MFILFQKISKNADYKQEQKGINSFQKNNTKFA